MSLNSYLNDLDPSDRPLAREWGEMDGNEFQARMGPEFSRIASLFEARSRWYNLRVSEIARIAAAAIIAAVGRGSM